MTESEDENRSAGEQETDYERLLALDAVPYYMEGGESSGAAGSTVVKKAGSK